MLVFSPLNVGVIELIDLDEFIRCRIKRRYGFIVLFDTFEGSIMHKHFFLNY